MLLGFRSFLAEQLLLTENKIKFFAKQANMSEDKMEKLAAADPNPKKKNLGWIVQQHKAGNIRDDMIDTFHQDDIAAHRKALERAETTKKEEPKSAKHYGDIMKVKDVHQLNAMSDDWHENHGKSALHKHWGQKVFDEDGHHIYHAETPEQASNHAEGTQWCTRIKEGGYQTHYLEHGNLYVHYPKDSPKPGEDKHHGGVERYQFWHPHEMDVHTPPELQDNKRNNIDADEHSATHRVLGKSSHWRNFENAQQEHKNEYEEGGNHHIEELAYSNFDEDRLEAVNDHGAHRTYDHLYEDESPDVRSAIVYYEKHDTGSTDHIFSHFADDDDHGIRAKIASGLKNPENIRHMWNKIPKNGESDENKDEVDYVNVYHPEEYTARTIAHNKNVPKDIAHSIIKNEHGFHDTSHREMINGVTKSKNFDSEMAHAILDRDTNDNRHLSNRTIQNIATHAKNKNDEGLINRLASSTIDSHQIASAQIMGNHPLVASKLKDSENPHVQSAMAQHFPEHYINSKNADVSRQAFNTLAEKDTRHPMVQAKLEEYAKSNDPELHELVAEHGSAKNIMQPNIINSNDQNVNKALARRIHNDTSLGENKDFHAALAKSTNPAHQNLAAMFTTDPEVLHSMRNSRDHNTIHSIIRNTNVSPKTVQHIADNADENAIHSIARSTFHIAYGLPHLNTEEMHRALAHSTNNNIQNMIAEKSHHENVLRELHASGAKVAWNIMSNPHTPKDIIEKYAQHDHPDVRKFAQDELKKRNKQ